MGCSFEGAAGSASALLDSESSLGSWDVSDRPAGSSPGRFMVPEGEDSKTTGEGVIDSSETLEYEEIEVSQEDNRDVGSVGGSNGLIVGPDPVMEAILKAAAVLIYTSTVTTGHEKTAADVAAVGRAAIGAATSENSADMADIAPVPSETRAAAAAAAAARNPGISASRSASAAAASPLMRRSRDLKQKHLTALRAAADANRLVDGNSSDEETNTGGRHDSSGAGLNQAATQQAADGLASINNGEAWNWCFRCTFSYCRLVTPLAPW